VSEAVDEGSCGLVGLAEYAPGKTLAVADALSRGPEQCYGDRDLQDDVAAHIDNVIKGQATSHTTEDQGYKAEYGQRSKATGSTQLY
ncbi:hypothetical protein NFI96_006360, partial [Prochilodus magdalenae]